MSAILDPAQVLLPRLHRNPPQPRNRFYPDSYTSANCYSHPSANRNSDTDSEPNPYANADSYTSSHNSFIVGVANTS